MQEEPENIGRIRNNGIFSADSNQMQEVDGKQKIYLKWPKFLIARTAVKITSLEYIL